MATPQAAGAISAERREAVARLVINRPPLNILDIETLRELRAGIQSAANEKGVRLIELAGAGDKAFSAGVEIRDHFPDRAELMLSEFHALIHAALDAPAPVIAQVRGHCLGGGMELALACDFIIASEDARFGQPEIAVGAFPPVAAVLLPRLIGESRAREMILTGDPITAAQACAWGLVHRVVPAEDLKRETQALENRLLARSPAVLALARKAERIGFRGDFEAALRESERIYLEELVKTRDAQEGLRAFLEKRPPKWTGD